MKPPAPTSYEIDIAGTGEDSDTLTITSPTGGSRGIAVFLSFELLSQDLLYAYESATNQLVFAEGDDSAPVELKDGSFKITSTFGIRLDAARGKTDAGEKFTLQQLKAIVEALFEFGDRFKTRNMKFSYKLQGKRRHLIGFLQFYTPQLDTSSPSLSNDLTSTSKSTIHNTSIMIAGGRSGRITDSHTIRAWDPLRLHPPAKITFSQYGARIPYTDIAIATYSIYQWAWDLILRTQHEDWNVELEAPLLTLEDVTVNLEGQLGWLPLWVVRSVVGSLFDFWVRGGERECEFVYASEERRTEVVMGSVVRKGVGKDGGKER